MGESYDRFSIHPSKFRLRKNYQVKEERVEEEKERLEVEEVDEEKEKVLTTRTLCFED